MWYSGSHTLGRHTAIIRAPLGSGVMFTFNEIYVCNNMGRETTARSHIFAIKFISKTMEQNTHTMKYLLSVICRKIFG